MIPEALPGYMMLFIKLMVILGIGLYTVFAGVMVRQEQLMSRVLEEQFEPVLRTLTLVHLAASFITLLLAIILL